MSKPSYLQIAKLAGVGTATVERVLNGRGNVRAETAERVLLAAKALDWGGRLPERHRGIVRIEVLLVRPETTFFARLSAAFRRIAATLDRIVQIQITFMDERDPHAIAARIGDRSSRRSALVVSTPNHALIRSAMQAAHEAGLPIVQLVNRNLPDAEYVGIDNYAAGRMAGLMMIRLGAAAGRVIAVRHSLLHRGHDDRVRGFSDYFREHPAEGVTFDYVVFGQDDRVVGARRVMEALRVWPDITGIYNAGGGNAGILEALGGTGNKVFFVGHELTDFTRAALVSGVADVILDQRPEAQARRAIDLVLAGVGLLKEPIENPSIRFTTITAENL